MKNYRKLVPLALIVFMALSIYSMISSAVKSVNELNSLVKKAETYKAQKLYEQAVSTYYEVINVDDDIKYYLNVIDMYFDAGFEDECIAWCEKTVNNFPKNAAGYERSLKSYIKYESYTDAFELLDAFDGRKLKSDKVEKYRKEIEYAFFDKITSYKELKQASSGAIPVKGKNNWGMISTKNKKIASQEYDFIGYLANGFFAASKKDEWYLLDSTGLPTYNVSEQIKGKITDIGLYNNDLLPICVDGKYAYYNISFKKIFGKYDFAGAFNNGVAAVKEGESWFLINTEGKKISNKMYDNIIVDDRGVCCAKDRIFVATGENYIMIDSSGKQVGKEQFEDAKLFVDDTSAAIKQGSLWGFVDHSGKIIIEPIYKDAQSFSMGLAPVCLTDKWGYINTSNEIVYDYEFLDCTAFNSNGTAFVLKDNNFWFLRSFYKYNH